MTDLIVPVAVEAMCVSPADAGHPPLMTAGADFQSLPTADDSSAPFLAESVVRKPFTTAAAGEIPGVHLHWALPDALTRAAHEYRLTGRAVNELRLLGAPDGVLAALLARLASENPDAVALQGLPPAPSGISPGAWGQIAAADVAAGPAYATPEAFLGLDGGGTDLATMASILTPAVATVHRAALTMAAGVGRFPPAPDRWLVVRLGPASAVRAWVVESDALSADASKVFEGLGLDPADPRCTAPTAYATTVPAPDADQATGLPPDGVPFRFLGRAVTAEKWAEDPTVERLPDLTAVGYGLPTFAASYPDCRTAFGLCDALDGGVGTASQWLSYLVVGWHSDSARDPLQRGVAGGRKPEDVLTELGWEDPSAAAAAGGSSLGAPQRTLYAGMVRDVSWDPAYAYLPAEPNPTLPDDTAVVVASSSAEALATHLARGVASDPHVPLSPAELLEGLQMGILDTLLHHGGDAHAALASARHANAYATRPGGTVWNVAGGEAAGGDGEAQPLADDVATLLNDLNTAQAAYDAQLDRVQARRSRLFAAWHLFLRDDQAPPGVRALISQNIRRTSTTTPDKLPVEVDALAKAAAAVTAALNDPARPLSALRAGPGARYAEPAEPVVLIAGPAAQPSPRFGGDRHDAPGGRLHCRLPDQVLTTPGAAAPAAQALSEAAAPGLPPDRRAVLTALLAEALLLAERFPLDTPGDRAAIVQRVIDNATADQPDYGPVDGFGGGRPPARLAVAGQADDAQGNAWYPIAMHWRASLKPTHGLHPGDGYPADLLTSTASLDPEGVDLRATSAPDPSIPAQPPITGISVLTARGGQTLASQATQLLGMGGIPDELKAPLATWSTRQTPVLSQALTGLNGQLLLRTGQMQLRVSSPDDQPATMPVAGWVGGATRGAPVPAGAFNPLRAGTLELDELVLVDAFGVPRSVPIPAAGPVVAASLTPFGGTPGEPSAAIDLPPRFVQPARLALRWLSASDDRVEMNDHPATSPVCGWVMTNHLDESLMVFGPDGAAWGAVRPGLAGHPVLEAPPGVTDAAAPPNPHLANLVAALEAGANDAFAAFTATLDRVCDTIAPANHREDDAVGLLVGRPLVLARAAVSLELHGPPAINPLPEALPATANGDLLAGITAGIENLLVDVRIGDVERDADGVVGYFAEDDYGQLRAEDEGPDLRLSAGASTAAPTVISMLLDPRGKVHATSGILPVTEARLPPEHYLDGLRALELSFLAAPLVGHAAADAIALPVPGTRGPAWHWRERAPDGGWAPVMVPAAVDAQARFGAGRRTVREGWLQRQVGDPPEKTS